MEKILKLSWGTRIFLLYTGFVLMIAFFVVRAMNQKVDLVAPDYYAQEISYQDKLDRMNRANALPRQLTWIVQDGSVKIVFPAEFRDKAITGEVLFFRPSDNARDVKIAIAANAEGEQVVGADQLSSGQYRMQVDWKADGVTYFNEGVVVIK